MTDEATGRVRLPEKHRDAFREPLGPIYTDVEAMLADAGDPIVAVGDVVTYHLTEADRSPDVAVIDGRTKRRAVGAEIESRLDEVPAQTIPAENPAGTITGCLVRALREALERAPPVQVIVDGEEDLGTIPAIMLAPTGATVVYGQPDEGMVRIEVRPSARRDAEALLDLMVGDLDYVRGLIAGSG